MPSRLARTHSVRPLARTAFRPPCLLPKPLPSSVGVCRRSYAFSPAPRQQSSTVDPNEHEFTDEELAEIDAFGLYSVVLPPESSELEARRKSLRPVPSHIIRPPYMAGSNWLSKFGSRASIGDRLVALGTEDEARLRRSAKLAKDVLHFAGSLVRVSAIMSNDSHGSV